MSPQLQIICAETGDTYPVMEGARIGRDPSAHIHLDSHTVSQNHARITVEHDAFVIEDLNSTNGIKLAGRSVRRVRLHPGQVLRLGDRHLHVADAHSQHQIRLENDPLDTAPMDVVDDPGDGHTVFQGGYQLPPGWSEEDYAALQNNSRDSYDDYRQLVRLLENRKIDSSQARAGLMFSPSTNERPIYLLRTEDGAEWTLGRHPNQKVVIDEATISGHHATITEHEGAWTITDHDSANGTQVNGRRIGGAPIESSDVITLGKAQLVFHVID